MKEEIWDGEMDYGWEDLAEKVRIVSNNFADVMLETVSFSPIKEAVDLISKESLQRLCLLADQLASQIKDGYYYQTEDAENNIQNASKLTSWIILGSLTETVLQMFLAFYIEDYKKTQWQQWVDFPAATVKEAVYQRKSYNSDEFEQYGNQSGYEEGDMLKQLEGKDIITLDDNKEIISAKVENGKVVNKTR